MAGDGRKQSTWSVKDCAAKWEAHRRQRARAVARDFLRSYMADKPQHRAMQDLLEAVEQWDGRGPSPPPA